MGLFDVFKKPKKQEDLSLLARSFQGAVNSETLSVNWINIFSKGQNDDRSIVSGITESMMTGLRATYLAYKVGEIKMEDLQRSLTFEEQNEFEKMICVLARTQSIKNEKSCLLLAEECLCPPVSIDVSFSFIFKFADELSKGINVNQEAFEDKVNSLLNESAPKNYSNIQPHVSPVEYHCPAGPVTEQVFHDFNKAIKEVMVNASIEGHMGAWFRSYPELTSAGIEYVKKIYKNGEGVIELSKIPGMNGNINSAFSVMCGTVLYAGIVAAEEYCRTQGNAAQAKEKILRMTNNEVTDTACRIMGLGGYNSGSAGKFASVPVSVANYLVNVKANPDLFMKSMFVSLASIFEYGTGLYYMEG